ncbi:unnamed protein product [Effrenium voratum]|nr:unnamed protein product [Effrenium voratum]
MRWLLLLLPLVAAKPCQDCAKDHLLLQHRHVKVQQAAQVSSEPGNMSGNESGNESGNMSGNLSGNMSGNESGNSTGNSSGNESTVEQMSIVEKHGQLQVVGNKVVDKNGEPVQLSGMSLFWSQWQPQFWTKETVAWLKQTWGITLLRCPMAVEAGGYLTPGNKQAELKKLETVVDAALELGIYVVIDWHDHNADQHQKEAAGFFKKMAKKYGSYPNVIFEVFNEPIKQSWEEVIKPYHEMIVEVIREHSTNLIVLGTRIWSQDVDVAAADPVAGENLAYTIHFYANTHKQELRDKVSKALELGAAVFATEWGTCDASGDGTVNLAEAQAWLDFFAEHHISHANWAVSDKQEACSALLPGASGEGGWEDCELSESGHFVRSMLRKEEEELPLPEPCPRLTTPPPGMCVDATEDCSEKKCCNEIGHKCFQKNEYWAACKSSCTPGIDPMDPPEWAAPWTCKDATQPHGSEGPGVMDW